MRSCYSAAMMRAMGLDELVVADAGRLGGPGEGGRTPPVVRGAVRAGARRQARAGLRCRAVEAFSVLPARSSSWLQRAPERFVLIAIGKFEFQSRLHRALQLQGHRPAEEGRPPVRRRARAPAPGQDDCSPAATSCCSTSRPTTSTSRRCARSRTRLLEFAGCIFVISHDRWFLDRIATHILAFEGDSNVAVLPRQLPRIRGGQAEAPGRRGGEAAPDQVQAAALSSAAASRRAALRATAVAAARG